LRSQEQNSLVSSCSTKNSEQIQYMKQHPLRPPRPELAPDLPLHPIHNHHRPRTIPTTSPLWLLSLPSPQKPPHLRLSPHHSPSTRRPKSLPPSGPLHLPPNLVGHLHPRTPEETEVAVRGHGPVDGWSGLADVAPSAGTWW
jgi:hypothetical protein